ncbi:hypothetical protein [Proteiniphilum sp. X52]|uniref:hypothetical protein n=1 Tax=Proteiniphilum sp. X52 TaxID=2382159 RepID=UPI00131442EC|nr:hypothetical protein [Proteiniphilum sp. X52]
MKEFIKAVKEMRTHQRAYFRTRSQSELQKSKEAEKKVDLMLAEMNREPSLF